MPAFYLFDREGNLRHFQAGDRGMKMIQGALDRVPGPSGGDGGPEKIGDEPGQA